MTSDSLAVLAAFSEGVWYFNKNDSVTQTMFYPHLKGFRYDTTNNIEDWPARRTKMTVTASEASGTYDGVVLTTQDEGYTNTALFTGDSIVSVTFEDKVSLGKGFRTPIDCKIVDYLGQDVTSKYQITYVAATMDFIPKEITITADNAAKEYDGTALTKNSYTNSKLADGDSITSVAINGSRIMAGESANVPSAAVIMNASNEDVTAFYHINYKNGTLDVTQKALTIIADGDTKEYDGTALTYNSFTFKGLVSGDAIESVTFSGTQTMVGSTNNVPSAAVIKNAAGQDVTTSYDITYVNGTLEVTQKAVTITADSASKDYDGTALTKDSVTAEGLAIGDTIESVTITGSQNTIGKSNNVPSAAVIKNAAGQDVTTSYDITYVNGTLEVTQKAVTITADSASKDYDGTALTKDSVTAEGLATGDKIESIFVTGSQTVVGKSDNTPSEAKIVNASGKDVTKCYEITYAKGTLEVTKKALTITADSDTKVYDKTALTKDSYTSSGLADGDSIKSIAITGSQTMKGSSDNVPSKAVIVNSKGEDVTACYAITYKNGTLTVTAPQAPALPDDQKPAPKNDLKEDGKEQVLVLDPAKLPEGYTIEYSTDGGKTWSAVPTGTRSGEYTIEVLYKADENHTDFFGDTLNVIIQGVYNQTDSDGDWTKGSGKTYTFRIKKAFNDETTYDNLTGVFVDGKKAEPGKDYTPAKGSAIITFAADYLETLSVGEHKIRVTFKDGEISVVLKILAAIATPTPAVDATPVTGDTANPFLWAALVLLSMAGVALMIEKKRRKA